MASTYSSYKFELIGTGEQAGVWGASTNTNIGTAIEQAIGGMATITFTGVLETLTLTNTSALQNARALYLSLAGAPGAAATLEVPAITKMYIVKNGTTGGYAVTVKVSGQTGVSVPNGSTYVLYVNGTDVVSVVGSGASLSANNTWSGTNTYSTTTTFNGTTVIVGAVTLTGAPVFTGASSFVGNMNIAGTLNVTVNAGITGTLTVGNLGVLGGATVVGGVIAASLTSSGAVYANSGSGYQFESGTGNYMDEHSGGIALASAEGFSGWVLVGTSGNFDWEFDELGNLVSPTDFPVPTLDSHMANKAYVDAAIADIALTPYHAAAQIESNALVAGSVGVASVSHTGTGVYRVTLSAAATSTAKMIITVQLYNTSAFTWSSVVDIVSTTVFDIYIGNGNSYARADCDCAFIVQSLPV